MDIIFKCPNCEQELEVDATGAGSKIECPSCAQTITVPQSEQGASAGPPPAPPAAGPAPAASKHFSVPVHTAQPTEVLITKSNKPLDVAAKESDKKMRIKTVKRSECLEVGRDRFDEIVSNFLDRVGQANIISINSINYSAVDMGSHQVLTDYGVLVVYRG